MITALKFFKSIVSYILSTLKETYQLVKLKQQYPLCQFYPGAKISNTTFEKYNVIFNNVLIDSSFIGAHTYIQKNSSVFNANIGKFCSIASGVSIGPGIHKSDGVTTHPAFYLFNTPLIKRYSQSDLYVPFKKTVIGNDVWIGERSIIIDGVTVGNGAIIAAGSVVTKSVEPYAIVGGVPAKMIKMRFKQEELKKIDNSRWWNNTEEWFYKNHSLFSDVKQFIQTLS